MVGRGAGSHVCCGVRSGSLSRLAARVAGDAVRRGQVQAERRMKARSSTSSPMEAGIAMTATKRVKTVGLMSNSRTTPARRLSMNPGSYRAK